ncbi:hypothetical protein AMS68_001016 [Peltaster fructicola]|uniref:Uncharacterized protein n=1 Tax=Peltaster fructicola TaxID=286661 RepID=A0A6H0XLJ6_9PEZI|nr:hypothetical protein AMS68_001016 [Peltaster fructicola]
MANSNGALPGQQNAGMYNANMNNMPAAGHYSDMQTLMQNMEALSGWLQQNREDFFRVQEDLEKVERIQGRPGALETVAENGDDTENPHVQRPTVSGLQRELDAAKSHIEELEIQHGEHLRLQSQYEDVLTEAVDRTRNYVFQQSEYVMSLHQHYIQLLQDSRKETISAQLIHQGWQASLSRLDVELKNAMKAREKEKDPFRRKIAMLEEENRVMREKLGWEKIVHDSDEEGEDAAVAMSRGRATKVAEDTHSVTNRLTDKLMGLR